jgi:hypothetical protein
MGCMGSGGGRGPFPATWPQNEVYLPSFCWSLQSVWIVLILYPWLYSFSAFSHVFHQLNFYLFLNAQWNPLCGISLSSTGCKSSYWCLSLGLPYFCCLVFYVFVSLFKKVLAGCQWLMPLILATQEADTRRSVVWSQSRQIVLKTLSWKKPKQNRAGRVAQVVEGLPSKPNKRLWVQTLVRTPPHQKCWLTDIISWVPTTCQVL